MISSVSSYKMPSGAERDAGLDFIRAVALLLMVIAHFPAEPAGLGPFSAALNNLGETAPAFFYFAFGMTFDRFLRKDRATKVESSFLFLYVALAHNLIVSGLLIMSFLAFLCLWRVVLAVTESGGPIRSRYYLGICFFILAGLLISPEFFHKLFGGMVENTPFVSWGMFVLAGLVFMRTPRFPQRFPFIILPLGFTAAVLLLGLRSFGPRFAFTKYPLSAPYVLACLGAGTLMVEVVRKTANYYRRLPLIPRVFEYISRNLLVATAVHYFAYSLTADLLDSMVIPLAPVSLSFLHTMSGRFIIGTSLSIVATVVMLRVVTFLWDRWQDRSAFAWLRANFHRNAVIILLADIVLINLRTIIKESPLAGLAGGHFGTGTSMIITMAGQMVLLYYCLEMTGHRTRPQAWHENKE